MHLAKPLTMYKFEKKIRTTFYFLYSKLNFANVTINIMDNITDLFVDLLRELGSIDIANDSFKKMINEEPELKATYREWCHSVGSSEKDGFIDFCEEYLDDQDSIYDSLSEYNDE